MPPPTPGSGVGGRYAAVDLGASSGRVVVGEVGPERLALTEVHRFPNRPVRLPSGLHWDVLGLHGQVLDGLAAAARTGPVDSIGVDTWAVDYGLLDATGALLGNPHCYRDARTVRGGPTGRVHQRAGRRRAHPLPAQRHGAVAAVGVPAHLAGGGPPG